MPRAISMDGTGCKVRWTTSTPLCVSLMLLVGSHDLPVHLCSCILDVPVVIDIQTQIRNLSTLSVTTKHTLHLRYVAPTTRDLKEITTTVLTSAMLFAAIRQQRDMRCSMVTTWNLMMLRRRSCHWHLRLFKDQDRLFKSWYWHSRSCEGQDGSSRSCQRHSRSFEDQNKLARSWRLWLRVPMYGWCHLETNRSLRVHLSHRSVHM